LASFCKTAKQGNPAWNGFVFSNARIGECSVRGNPSRLPLNPSDEKAQTNATKRPNPNWLRFVKRQNRAIPPGMASFFRMLEPVNAPSAEIHQDCP
jgi:hypothetical protein